MSLPAALLLVGCSSISALFAPKARVAEGRLAEVLQSPPGTAAFDHDPWGRVLAAAVDERAGLVDYDAVEAHRVDLDAYTTALATADLAGLSADARMATLINAYNAFTVQLIVDQPTRPASIRDLDDPWGTARFTLAGQPVSLDELEHGLLRPIYRDPRIHFAVNCASIGCPPLRAAPFTGDGLDAQLDAAARDTLSRPRHLRIDDGALHATRLLEWYGGDFTAEGWAPAAESRVAWLAAHGPAEVRALVDAAGGDVPLRFLDYDWALNDVQ